MRDGFEYRLRKIRKALGFTAEDAAKMAGLRSRNTWEAYEKGNSTPRLESVQFLVDRGLNLDWLVTSNGDMMTSRDIRNALVHQGRFSDVAAACLEYLREQGRDLAPEKAGAFLLAAYMTAEREVEREGGQISAAEFKACVQRILQIHNALAE